MNSNPYISFILLLVRHGLVALGGVLAAHGFQDTTTTQGLVLGLACLAGVTFWSWIANLLKFDPVWAYDPTKTQVIKTAVGSLISQGITFLSVYFATDANDPSKLGLAVMNMVASHYGVHQQIAHQTPIATASAIKAAALCFLLGLSSCTGVTAFLVSPVGQATVASAVALGKQLEKAVVENEVAQVITKASASLAALKAQGVNSSTTQEIARQGEIAALQTLITAAQNQYIGMTGAAYVIPTVPVPAPAVPAAVSKPAAAPLS